MANVQVLFRVDIGFDPDRGYAATITDVKREMVKGIKGNSIEQLVSRIRNVVIDETHKKRSFPLESERSNLIGIDGKPL